MRKTVKAFTIVEITIVLGLMSMIIALISFSYNRFNEQLKKSVVLNDELNMFFAFRSNLWDELYQADSIRFDNNIVQIFKPLKTIEYRIEDNYLERNTGSEWVSTSFEMEQLMLVEKNSEQFIQFDFVWKDQVMRLEYLLHSSIKRRIDNYFENIND